MGHFSQVLKGRRALLYPSLWKPVPQMTTWTTNGSLGRRLKLQAVTKQALVKGRPTNVALAPIPNNYSNEYQIGEEASKEEAQVITFRPASFDDDFFVVNNFTNFFHRMLERFSYSLSSDFDSCLLEKVKQAHPSDAFKFKRAMSPG